MITVKTHCVTHIAKEHLYINHTVPMVWLVERLLVIYFRENDSNPPSPPLEKVEPNLNLVWESFFGSTFSKGGFFV